MINYYKVLRVPPNATDAEIKRAYRRLAKKYHPDLHGGSEEATKRFALIVEAYEVLSNPQERAYFDKQLAKAIYGDESKGSIFSSDNYYARKLRQIALEKRYNQIIDEIINVERKEVLALQKIIFPLVGLFLSIFFVAIFRPRFFANSNLFTKIILFSLFITGTIHLLSRLKDGIQKYTYKERLHDSIFEEFSESRSYSRATALMFILFGMAISATTGVLIGNYIEMFVSSSMPGLFSPTFQFEFILYPPIIVLLVDFIHSFTSRD
ncbi:MAG: J domain-containing protein [Pyrinomonadaceae bacterium]|nr:J domain-containing protein [Pyrinomonadaceae bacterium]MCX7640401.1 J domain-containing protein [Pyrinomonadaceae bacterium]